MEKISPKNPANENLSKMESYRYFGQILSRQRNNVLRAIVRSLAEIIGVSPRMLSRWESGEAYPTQDKLPLIAEAYQLDLQKLTEALEISRKAHGIEEDASRHAHRKDKGPKKSLGDYFSGAGFQRTFRHHKQSE